MKKTLFYLALIFIGTIGTSFGQRMYTQFSVGYGLPVGTQSFGYDNTETMDPNDDVTRTTTSVNGSLGSGINFNGAFGFMFSPFLGLDVNVNYLLGNKYSLTNSYSSVDFNGAILDQNITNETIKSSGIFISPTFIVNISGEKFSPYGKLGVVVGSLGYKWESTSTRTASGSIYETIVEEENTTGDVSLGIRGGIGVTYQIKNNLSIYGEGIYTGMNYLAKESDITKYEYNGDDLLQEYFPGESSKTLYKKELHESQYDPYAPREELQTPSPLSSFSFNFGIRLSFGGI